jgi:hypothetical protein
MEAEKIPLLSSDYPRWTFDEPQWVAQHLPAQMREKVMFGNAHRPVQAAQHHSGPGRAEEAFLGKALSGHARGRTDAVPGAEVPV